MSKASKVRPRIPFFELNATYSIDPEAAVTDLLEDLSCLLGVGVGTLLETGCEKLSQTQWAGVYAIQQAHAILQRVVVQVDEALAKGPAA